MVPHKSIVLLAILGLQCSMTITLMLLAASGCYSQQASYPSTLPNSALLSVKARFPCFSKLPKRSLIFWLFLWGNFCQSTIENGPIRSHCFKLSFSDRKLVQETELVLKWIIWAHVCPNFSVLDPCLSHFANPFFPVNPPLSNVHKVNS